MRRERPGTTTTPGTSGRMGRVSTATVEPQGAGNLATVVRSAQAQGGRDGEGEWPRPAPFWARASAHARSALGVLSPARASECVATATVAEAVGRWGGGVRPVQGSWTYRHA